MRLDRKYIDISISDQSSLYDLHTTIKLHCYKDVYKVTEKKPTFPFISSRKDFIPPDSNNQLSCVIRDLIVAKNNTEFLPIPNNPKRSIKEFMSKNPEFFVYKQNKYIIYVIDEKTIQEYNNSPSKPPSFVSDLKTTIHKYFRCARTSQ
jgi:hypothetical protein